jgi:predicted DNA-binding transcriptional regulator YafY
MSAQGTIRRYTLEIEKISSYRYPSFQVLQNFLHDHGLEISKRTLQRDIEDIRYEFGVDIKYDRNKRGYYIDIENSPEFDTLLHFLELVNTADIISESISESKKALKYISFEGNGSFKGTEYLRDLLYAILNQRKIAFLHKSFTAEAPKERVLYPYLLKEYQNRWYIVGFLPNDEFRIFGIDRIETLKVTTETFKHKARFNANDLFDNTIGVSTDGSRPSEVILNFSAKQAKYIQTLPLHPSQMIVKETRQSVTVSLSLVINLELVQKILSFGDKVKVISPQRLRFHVTQTLRNTLAQYK